MPKHRTEYYQKSFHHSALKDWNNTPIYIRELPTLSTSEKRLKTDVKSKTQNKHEPLEEYIK